MIRLLHHYLQTRRLKRELAEFSKQFEATLDRNLAARKRARLSGQTYVGPHTRRRGAA